MLETQDSDGLNEKRQRTISVLRKHRGLVVALSGGVDSGVLLALACEAIGKSNVVAFTGRSSAVTEEEIEDATRVAEAVGARHVVVDTHEIDDPGYRANRGDRCFHCRSELFHNLVRFAAEEGIPAVAYGAILDDLAEDRPGMRAASEMGIHSPLIDAHLYKDDVRQLANVYKLHVYDKPSNACLASRIPMGTEVTAERLIQVREAEAALRRLGFRQVRVRHHGDVARIELGGDDFLRLADAAVRAEIAASVRRAGFRFVTLDLVPYRPSGLYSIEPARDGGQ